MRQALHEGFAIAPEIRDQSHSTYGGPSRKHVSDKANPGAILKRLRAEREWTLADVSARTGFPISTLSKIEKGQVSLSYDKLARISNGLDVDIGVFFSADEARLSQPSLTGRRSIVRKGEGRTIETHSYLTHFLATDLLNKRFVPIFGEGLATSIEEFGEMIRHAGEEFCYVLEGTLELHTEFYAPVTLEVGDSIYFDSGMGHAYISVGDTPCKILCICSGEESKLVDAHGGPEQTSATPAPPKKRRPRTPRPE